MTNFKVYYDYFDGVKVPIWIIVNAKEVNWEDDIYTLHIQAPFELHHSQDFDPYSLNATITMHDITINAEKHKIGIKLNSIKERLKENSIEYNDVSNFIIQLVDIEEVLQLEIGD